MRITNVEITENSSMELGLHKIKMDRLGKLVVISGPNGSGKTRLMNTILKYGNSRLSDNDLEHKLLEVRNLESEVKNNPNPSNIHQLNKAKLEIEKQQYIIFSEKEKTTNRNLIQLVPRSDLFEVNSMTKTKLKEVAVNFESNSIHNLSSVNARIQYLQNEFWEATHQYSELDEKRKTIIKEKYNSLKESIAVMLDTEITRSTEGEAQLFGLPLDKSQLSNGQKILLQICVLLHTKEVSLKDAILIMDEPENHLHPSALIEIIERIVSSITTGQVWIATHSITLLSYLDTSSYWYMKDNSINYVGRKPQEVINGLLGNDTRLEKLQDFINLPAQFAIQQFAYECLFSPPTVGPNVKDDQTTQIRKFLFNYPIGTKIRILDYGIGKARLLSTIYQETSEHGPLSEWLDYVGFDVDDKDKNICSDAFERVYGAEFSNRYFNNESNLLSKFNTDSFDLIIMCNVLHEIRPNDWLSLFSRQSVIIQLLKEDGHLLLVEDQLLPIGEKAYKHGFIVLPMPSLKVIFNIREDDKGFNYSDAREDGRLMAYKIPKDCLTRISRETRTNALKNLRELAKIEIQRLRSQNPSYKNGKLHSFWTQQFANSQLVLDELGE